MEYPKLILHLVLFLIVINMTYAATTVNMTAMGDTYVAETATGTNYGTNTQVQHNDKNPSGRVRGYWIFENSMGASPTVYNAVFHYYFEYVEAGGTSHYIHGMNRSQNENLTTWDNQLCGTEFNDGTYCNLTIMDSYAVTSTGWKTANVTATVKEAAEKGINITFATITPEAGGASDHWTNAVSKEHTTGTQHSWLEINYDVGGGSAPSQCTMNITNGANFNTNITLACTGSTDPDGDPINYEFWQDDVLKQNTTAGNYTTTWSSDGNYLFEVNVTDGTFYGTPQTGTYTLDTVSPIISANYYLRMNLTNTINQTIYGQINFTDETEIYSINVTYGNATTLFKSTNMGITYYSINFTNGTSNTPIQNITAKICDAHTLNSISIIDNNKLNGGIEYVMKSTKGVNEEWVQIYPVNDVSYGNAITVKQDDRYIFTFNKLASFSFTEQYYVLSSHKIDIIESKTYPAHLVIPSIGKNGYWVDFATGQSVIHDVTRISDNAVLITITGLSGSSITFNSIGELNCVEQIYMFGSLNPLINYTAIEVVESTTTSNLTINGNSITIANISATFFYNGTAYDMGSTYNFSKTVNTPSEVSGDEANITLYWQLIVNGVNYTFTHYNQSVQEPNLDNCTKYKTKAINYTFYDEVNNSNIYADITGAYISTSGGALSNTYNLVMNNNKNYSICVFPNNASLTGSYTLYYSNDIYPQRTYVESSAVYTPTTLIVPLYLLSATDGIYGRFRLTDQYDDPVVGATGTMSLSSTTREIQTSDGSGLMTFWVNPDTTYDFTFTASGYTSYSTSLRMTNTEIYSVLLNSLNGTSYNASIAEGISWFFRPQIAQLQNNTPYNFTFNLTSSIWNITSCKVDLYNITNNITTFLKTMAGTATPRYCNISIEANTSNMTQLRMYGYYIINGTVNMTEVNTWSIVYSYTGEFSLKTMINDINSFTDAGFSNFTKSIIAIIIIMFVAGGLATTSLTVRDTPISLGIIITVMAWLFAKIDWLNVPYPAPVIAGVEATWLNQYIIPLILTILLSAWIIEEYR